MPETPANENTAEANKRVIRRFIAEVRNRGNMEVLREIAAPELVETLNGARGRHGFSGYNVEIVELLAEGDRVMMRGIQRGVHTADFLGIPPTGREVAWDVVRLFTLHDSRIVDTWVVSNNLSLLQQMGASIAPPATLAP